MKDVFGYLMEAARKAGDPIMTERFFKVVREAKRLHDIDKEAEIRQKLSTLNTLDELRHQDGFSPDDHILPDY